ncbi:MAG: hypothetical protein IPF42_19925 [Candidatus Microthrix sp.]|nr:hypothetical protein [Candidatus Microthrix sp.]
MRSPPRGHPRQTAARIFESEPDKGDDCSALDLQRWSAMELAYGMGLRLEPAAVDPHRREQVILDAYFEGFPNVRAYSWRKQVAGRGKGYTETLLGRRRQVSDWPGCRGRSRQAGERRA